MTLLVTLAILTFGARADDPDLTVAAERLAHVFEPYVEPLERPLVIFRYEAKPDFGARSIADVIDYLRRGSSRFTDETIQNEHMLGPGLYAALDPNGTRSYGKDQPSLFIMTLKSMVKILNTTASLSAERATEIRDAIRPFACAVDYRVEAEALGRIRNARNPRCRRLAIETMRRLGASAILYAYPAAAWTPACRNDRDYAINVTDPAAIDLNEVAMASDVLSLGNVELLGLTKKLFGEGASDAFLSGKEIGLKMPNALVGVDIGRANYSGWKQSHVYSCGTPRPSERAATDRTRYLTALRDTFRDATSHILFSQILTPYLMKSNYQDFRVARLRWAQELAFEASGAREAGVSFAAWIQANRSLDETNLDAALSDERLQSVLRLLGERTSVPFDGARLEHDLALAAASQGTFDVRAALVAGGLPPLTAFVYANRLIYEAKGVPILDKGDSRPIFRHLLQTCLSEYQRADLTADALARSACGGA